VQFLAFYCFDFALNYPFDLLSSFKLVLFWLIISGSEMIWKAGDYLPGNLEYSVVSVFRVKHLCWRLCYGYNTYNAFKVYKYCRYLYLVGRILYNYRARIQALNSHSSLYLDLDPTSKFVFSTCFKCSRVPSTFKYL